MTHNSDGSALFALLDRLESAKIYYTLQKVRDGYIGVFVTVPGERWEIEFSGDGGVEVEIFRSNGEIRDESAIDDLFRDFSD